MVKPKADAKEDAEQAEVDHHLVVSGLSLATALIGHIFYPLLFIPAVTLALYNAIPVFADAFAALRQWRIRFTLIDSIAILGALATQYYVAATLAGLLYFVAQKLVLITQDRSKQGLTQLFGMAPREVWVLHEGVEIAIPFEGLQVGDCLVLHAGEIVPIDGTLIAGYASIDQHSLTGESQPVDKAPGDAVLAGTMVVAGTIHVRVDRCGAETTAAKIGDILQNTADYRSSVEVKGIQFANRLAPPTLLASGLALVTLGPASAVATVSCNFAEIIRIVAPIGVLNFLRLATEHGLLIKDGRSLELLRDIDTVVFDKTGTLTLEQPQVGGIHVWSANWSEDDLLRHAAAAEYKQTHPIAQAIRQAAAERDLDLPVISTGEYEIGHGIKVTFDDRVMRVGSERFMHLHAAEIPATAEPVRAYCHECGHSLVYIAVAAEVVGAIELHTSIRPEAASVIQALRERGLDIYILSGDHEQTTRHLAKRLGIVHYFAETLPKHKADKINALQTTGKSVCFVGDGINDAIALKTAHVGISIKGASTVATDTAGIILMDGSLEHLPYLFALGHSLERNQARGFAAAIVPGSIGLGGVFLLHFSIYSAIVLYMVSLIAGMGNAMAPLLLQRIDGPKEGLDITSPPAPQ